MSCQTSWNKHVETSDLKLPNDIHAALEQLEIFEFTLEIECTSTPAVAAIIRQDPGDSHPPEPEEHEYTGDGLKECCAAIPELFVTQMSLCECVILANALEQWLESYLADDAFMDDASDALDSYQQAQEDDYDERD